MPDEWYRRSKSRTISSNSANPSEETIKGLTQSDASDDESEEGGGTAKQKNAVQDTNSNRSSVSGFVAPTDWRGSISQNRFSSMLESWIRPSSPLGSSSASPPEKKIVSEPKLVAQSTGGFSNKDVHDQLSGEELNLMDYEQMLVSVLVVYLLSRS